MYGLAKAVRASARSFEYLVHLIVIRTGQGYGQPREDAARRGRRQVLDAAIFVLTHHHVVEPHTDCETIFNSSKLFGAPPT